MQEIHSLVSHPVVASGNLMGCFPTVSRPLYLPTQAFMQFPEPALGFDEEAWIGDCFPVTQCGEILQANIDADFTVGEGVFFFSGFKLTGEDSEPLPCPVTLNSQRLEFTPGESMQDNGDVPYPIDMKSFIGKQLESRLWESDRLNSLLEAWKTNLNSLSLLFLLDSAKEVFVGFSESVSTVLENLGVNLPEFNVRVFKLLDDFAQFGLCIKRSAVYLIRHITSFKKHVVGLTAQIKLRKQPSSLFPGRIQSELIASQLHGSYYDSPLKYLQICGTSVQLSCWLSSIVRSHPTTEVRGLSRSHARK